MAKNIEPKLKKIGDYLKLEGEAKFFIPEYQRAYSWGIENCDKLFQDVREFAECGSNDRYFFGTIIINCQDNDTKFSLIDGQQRTTTFLLLLKALLLNVNKAIKSTGRDEDSVALCRGLQERRRRIMGILYKAESEDISDSPDTGDISICNQDIILKNCSINEKYKEELKIILQAPDYETAMGKVTQIKYKRKDNRYTNFFRNFKFFYEEICNLPVSELNLVAKTITENCEVIEIKSWLVEQAITMFNSLNSDGLPLYDSDIISAKLYAEAEKLGQESDFKDKWEKLNIRIEKLSGVGIRDVNSLLMQYMYYIRTQRRETVGEQGGINVTTPGLRRYFTEINKGIVATPMKMCVDLGRLIEHWAAIAKYPIVQVLLKFNDNSKLFLAGYLLRFAEGEIVEANLTPVLESMIRLFALLELLDVGYSSRLFKTFLFSEHGRLIDATIPTEEIVQDFLLHIRSNWDEAKVQESLAEYAGNALVYLNEYLFAKEKGEVFSLGTRCDIEHIMPTSGGNLQEIRKDANLEDESDFSAYMNMLGNKILLEESINRAIGNEWFRTKVSSSLTAKTGYINSSYPIARALVENFKSVNKPYWTKEDIHNATSQASSRITRFIFGENV